MKETAITFTKGEKNYVSDAVQVNSAEVGLQITFEKGGKLWVYISYDGQNYSPLPSRGYTKVFAFRLSVVSPDSISKSNVKRNR